jgi:transposase-like protein
MASATGKFTGFGVVCPYCSDDEATVTLNLNDLAECHCEGCSETFTPEMARDLAAAELARWEEVVRWIALAAPAEGY